MGPKVANQVGNEGLRESGHSWASWIPALSGAMTSVNPVPVHEELRKAEP